jgi:hypothetical protein
MSRRAVELRSLIEAYQRLVQRIPVEQDLPATDRPDEETT